MLAISTATKSALIGISYNGQNYYSEILADCRQSENILKEIDLLLEKNNISFSEIGNIAVVVGPGSFTGIRIGVALVKGLCAGDKTHKVYALSTLDFMAKTFLKKEKPNENFLCVMNALSGRFFVCEYDKEGKKIGEEKMLSDKEILSSPVTKVFLGEEFDLFKGISLDSKVLLEFALETEKKEEGKEASQISPVYIRKSQAEENLG